MGGRRGGLAELEVALGAVESADHHVHNAEVVDRLLGLKPARRYSLVTLEGKEGIPL